MKPELKKLFALQELDLALDAIQQKKGALPVQIQTLQSELEGLEAKKDQHKAEVTAQETHIEGYQETKKNADASIKKYQDEQVSVSDSRSYDTISKEIALQELEIQLSQKNIKEAQGTIKEIKEKLSKVRARIRETKESIKLYKQELSEIQSQVQEEETKLQEQRPSLVAAVDPALLGSYEEMRTQLIPPHVLTYVREEACAGCFCMVSPQKQAIIAEHKKTVRCENCSRILVDVIKPEEKPKRKPRRRTTKKATIATAS